MARSFFIVERTKRSALRPRRGFARSSPPLPLLDRFYPDEINGFFPAETSGRRFRKPRERCLALADWFALLLCALLQRQRRRRRRRRLRRQQPLLSVSGLVLQLQKVDRYTTRRARPIDTGRNFVQRACRT